MIRISQIKAPLTVTPENLAAHLCAILSIAPEAIVRVEPVRCAVDARRKYDVHKVWSADVKLESGLSARLLKNPPKGLAIAPAPASPPPPSAPRVKVSPRPVVVGAGPAGLFAALSLCAAQNPPIILEQGDDVDTRAGKIKKLQTEGVLDTESNVQFGEGGAGTFSDGKLTTGTKDPRIREVLLQLVRFGAPADILYEAKPHIGTDILHRVVRNVRKVLTEQGAQFLFRTRLERLHIENGRIVGLHTLSGQEAGYIHTCDVVLAIGHSARDSYEMLHALGVPMAAKAFSVGVRIEHLQRSIDLSQYGKAADSPYLGAADYKLACHLKNGRSVYTFCMCPGGQVIAAASEENGVVTNGMSVHARNGKNANSALLVGVAPEDFESGHPLAGMYFARRLERQAYSLGGGGYIAPAQRVEDFLRRRPSKEMGQVSPTYRPGVAPADLSACLPGFAADALRQALPLFEQKLSGFAHPDALLTGVETRSSAPVRILRDEQCMSPVSGLFPCGEGAGYAGGIMSSAVDGLRCAQALMARRSGL